MKFTNTKGLLTLCLFLFVTTNSFGQSFTFSYMGTKNWKSCKSSKLVVYVSPIFMGTEEIVEKKYSDFKKKYSPISDSYANQSSKTCEMYTSWLMYIDHLKTLEQTIKVRNEIIADYRADGYEVIVINDDSESTVKPITTETYFTNLKIEDDLYIDGHVTIKSKFVFFGYPYIVAEYQNLTINSIRYKSNTYISTTINKELFSLPYTPKNKPLIDAEFWVWTPKIINAKPTRKEHYKIFSYPVKSLAAITDNFDNNEVDAYFKEFKHQEKSDSFFWESSLLQNPKQSSMGSYSLAPINITKITGTLAQELKTKLKKYNYDNKHDFWGNEKSKPKKEKKTKKDDFWNN